MIATIIPAARLSSVHFEQWSALQGSNPLLATPCLRPELFAAVGRFHKRVFVAVLEQDGRNIGFLPFQRGWVEPVARPVPLCDYEAVITSPDQPLEIRQVLQACGLAAWVFQHLVAPSVWVSQADSFETIGSPVVCLPEDFEHYVDQLHRSGKTMRNLLTKFRLLQRDFGEARFVPEDQETGLLGRILEWKADRFNAGRKSPAWILNTLQLIHEKRTVSFAGVLSTLRAGDKLVAAHFGIKSNGIFHYWFPAFNPQFQRYTPGWILAYLLLRHLGDLGCRMMDFGPGGEEYKRYFANSETPIARGFFESPSVTSTVRRAWRKTESAVRGNPVAFTYLRPLGRILRKLKLR